MFWLLTEEDGAAKIIPKLIEKEDLLITSVVNAYDDGKSTGEIRKFFKMLGPSDIRKVQELMLPVKNSDYKSKLQLFRFRFRQIVIEMML